MSIFSSIAKVAVGALTGFATGGPIGAAVGGLASFAPAPAPVAVAPRAVARPTAQQGGFRVPQTSPFLQQASLPALPVMSRLPAFGQGAVRPPTRELALAGGGGGVCPSGFHLDKRTRSRCVRNRRMNPLNGRAASRAIRRIKGARKMLQKIERSLPRAKSSRTPAHGHRTTVKAT